MEVPCWVSWIKHPSSWLTGTRIAIAFQRFTQSGPHPDVVEEVSKRARKNERFYQLLDRELQHTLLMPGEGSVYIARTAGESKDLTNMQNGLTKEQREFPFLSDQQVINAFGFLPHGEAFAKKTHDRTLSPHFLTLLSNRVLQKGGTGH